MSLLTIAGGGGTGSGGGGAAAAKYGAIAGNTGLAYTFSNATNPIQHSKTKHRVVAAGTNLRFTFANFVLNNQGELTVASTNGYYNFSLRAGVKIRGTFYPLTFSGARDRSVPFGTWATSDPLNVAVAPGDVITVYNRRTADNLSASNYNNLASHQAVSGSGEGTMGTTSTALDYTTGGVPGGDVADISLANAAGVLTATLGTAHGTGYTSTAVVSVLDPAAIGAATAVAKTTNGSSASGQAVVTLTSTTSLAVGMLAGGHANIPAGAAILSISAGVSVTLDTNLSGIVPAGNQIGFITPGYPAGVGFSATCTQTGGVLNNPASLGHGFNYSSRTFGAISGGGGFGGNQQSFGPAAITGTQTTPGVTLQLLGHSITRGVGANDGIGDEYRNFGLTERAFRSLYPSINNSVIGNTILAIRGTVTPTNYATTYAMVASLCNPTHVYICNATNDFAAGTPMTLASAKAVLGAIITREKALGKKIIVETHEPRTTSTDAWATTANQTPINAPFTAGGDVDLYDAWLLAGGSGADYVVDVRPFCRDGTLTDRWKVDTGAFTSDGIHPGKVDEMALAMASSMPVLS